MGGGVYTNGAFWQTVVTTTNMVAGMNRSHPTASFLLVLLRVALFEVRMRGFVHYTSILEVFLLRAG